jgi:tetratricopeptide (TPR) repeat protein
MRRNEFGAEHPTTIRALEGLAEVLRDSARYDEAEDLFSKVVDSRRLALHPHHPAIARSLGNLAVVMQERGNLEQAESLFQEALSITIAEHGDAHWRTAYARVQLGECLTRLRRYQEAEADLLKGHEGLGAALGYRHETTISAARALVSLYEQWGRTEEAADARTHLIQSARLSISPDE